MIDLEDQSLTTCLCIIAYNYVLRIYCNYTTCMRITVQRCTDQCPKEEEKNDGGWWRGVGWMQSLLL